MARSFSRISCASAALPFTRLEHGRSAAAPNTGVNTITGKGLKEAMADAQVVIDLAMPHVPFA
jgi:hypothetical protein